MKNRNIFSVSGLVIFILFSAYACKKDKTLSAEAGEIISPVKGTRTQFTLDSIFLYASQVYLWHDALPSYANFNPRFKYEGIRPDLVAFRKELFDISQFKLNSVTNTPYELPVNSGSAKYSYLEAGLTTTGATAGIVRSANVLLSSKLISSGALHIAYIALGSFPKLNEVQSNLDQAFSDLASGNPRYIIIDLRSNAGGYIETAEYIANLVVPGSLTGKVMYSEQFNSKMQAGQASILKNQPYLDADGKMVSYQGRKATMADVDYSESGNTYRFNKKGNLTSIEEVYFIVSGKTASASELLISCLKPYLYVKLIGEKTYGKPVGFFGIHVDQYSVYLSSFLIRNAAGWSDYFSGMTPDITAQGVADPELGNPEEPYLKAAITAINGGTKREAAIKTAAKVMSVPISSTLISNEISTDAGMRETRLRLK